jgi:hypothetical protein
MPSWSRTSRNSWGWLIDMNFPLGSSLPGVADAVATTTTRSGQRSFAGVRTLQLALVAQIGLGLVWGISMLFFAGPIALSDPSGPHIEKIALEGGAHFALVFGAVLVWRAPHRSRDLLLVMIFLNALWAVTDAVYIPLLHLTAVDFYAKLIVNAGLAIALAAGAWRGRILSLER